MEVAEGHDEDAEVCAHDLCQKKEVEQPYVSFALLTPREFQDDL
jgi:hypothetical protein